MTAPSSAIGRIAAEPVYWCTPHSLAVGIAEIPVDQLIQPVPDPTDQSVLDGPGRIGRNHETQSATDPARLRGDGEGDDEIEYHVSRWRLAPGPVGDHHPPGLVRKSGAGIVGAGVGCCQGSSQVCTGSLECMPAE